MLSFSIYNIIVQLLINFMRKDKEKAIQFRKDGLSYNEIAKKLNIPKSTLNTWLSKLIWSDDLKNQLSSKNRILAKKRIAAISNANKKRWQSYRTKAQAEATIEFEQHKNKPVFIAGIMLYTSLGAKERQIKISSSDPDIINIFCLFLRLIGFPQDKIFVQILMYSDMPENPTKTMWSKLIGIPLHNFKKSVIISRRDTKRRTSFGTCSICISDHYLLNKIKSWIDMNKTYLRSQ